ncbi:MAG: hypothetical protein WC804_12885 [Sphingomonas sp.]|jgi:hypothetical protein|uniref:hypothetical protein n=1 Tax=Sphingomonas sp. TaxID=28214 RepID=UPI0035690CB0
MIHRRVSRRALLAGASGLACVALAPSVLAAEGGGAIKHYILIELLPGADQLELDRWYMTFHAPQVRRAFQAWQRDYLSFRSYLPPEPAVKRYRVEFGRMTEIHFASLDAFRESRRNSLYGELSSFTPPPGGWARNRIFRTVTATIPVNPDTLYLSQPTPPKEEPYFRWIAFLRYPAGVSLADGDAWFDSIHAREVSKLPGLRRFGFYKTVSERAEYARVMELWFDDYAAWQAAFLNPEPHFTPPVWAKTYPFFETASMFVGENPDIDFIHDDRVIP